MAGVWTCSSPPRKNVWRCRRGLAFAAVSARALERAQRVPQRGLYFDFVEWEKFHLKHQTPATPAISLLWALDAGLDRILAEGLANRFARHAQLAARTQAWAQEHFALFAPAPYRSPTVTCITNTRQINIAALNAHLRAKGMQISDGYGKLKRRDLSHRAYGRDSTE
jgi:aspartate aminotransferase-like enzyme